MILTRRTIFRCHRGYVGQSIANKDTNDNPRNRTHRDLARGATAPFFFCSTLKSRLFLNWPICETGAICTHTRILFHKENHVQAHAVNHSSKYDLCFCHAPYFTSFLMTKNKTAFEAQRMEIAALHTAGERAVVRTSRIRRELDTSEKELTTLEREMNEIGQFVLPRVGLSSDSEHSLGFRLALTCRALGDEVRNSFEAGTGSGSVPEGNESIAARSAEVTLIPPIPQKFASNDPMVACAKGG